MQDGLQSSRRPPPGSSWTSRASLGAARVRRAAWSPARGDPVAVHTVLICDLSDGPARLDQIQDLASELHRMTPEHDDFLRVDMPEMQPSEPRETRRTPEPAHSVRFRASILGEVQVGLPTGPPLRRQHRAGFRVRHRPTDQRRGAAQVLQRTGSLGMTSHGLRSSFRDWCAETAASRESAEACLAHVVKNTVEAAYRRSDLLEQRRAVMEAWACLHRVAPLVRDRWRRVDDPRRAD